jgi:hypothetical protein
VSGDRLLDRLAWVTIAPVSARSSHEIVAPEESAEVVG